MIPYEIAWTARCTERRRTGTRTMPDENTNYSASLLRLFGLRINRWNLRNRTRDGGISDGQFGNPDALTLKHAMTEKIRGEKK